MQLPCTSSLARSQIPARRLNFEIAARLTSSRPCAHNALSSTSYRCRDQYLLQALSGVQHSCIRIGGAKADLSGQQLLRNGVCSKRMAPKRAGPAVMATGDASKTVLVPIATGSEEIEAVRILLLSILTQGTSANLGTTVKFDTSAFPASCSSFASACSDGRWHRHGRMLLQVVTVAVLWRAGAELAVASDAESLASGHSINKTAGRRW